jgi:RNA polymerase sigma-70 factor (ECF subfamily)
MAGLMALDQRRLEAELDAYHWFHAARADLLRRAGYFTEARLGYETALNLCENGTERAFLTRRLAQVSANTGSE